jgi:glycerate dehydrogenase
MKAVFLDFATLGPDLDVGALRDMLPELEIHAVTEASQVRERIRGAEVVLTNKVRLTEDLLNDSPELKFIGLTATGTDNVDLSVAEAAGVAVANIRGYCTQSVAEHVFGCLLNLNHNLARYDVAARNGGWQASDDFCLLSYPIVELSGKSLGIVGYGALGQGVAKIAEAFAMNVLISARPGARATAPGRVAFDELLRRADVVSLHCPLNDATRGLFSAAEFSAMKSTAILINTARGGLVDTAALAAALSKGEIAAAAIDVLPQEPPVDGDPLLDYVGHNLMVTPHVAWGTLTSRQAAVDELVANIAAFMQGEKRNRVV